MFIETRLNRRHISRLLEENGLVFLGRPEFEDGVYKDTEIWIKHNPLKAILIIDYVSNVYWVFLKAPSRSEKEEEIIADLIAQGLISKRPKWRMFRVVSEVEPLTANTSLRPCFVMYEDVANKDERYEAFGRLLKFGDIYVKVIDELDLDSGIIIPDSWEETVKWIKL